MAIAPLRASFGLKLSVPMTFLAQVCFIERNSTTHDSNQFKHNTFRVILNPDSKPYATS